MLTYTVRLPGARTLGGRLPGRVLGDLMHALSASLDVFWLKDEALAAALGAGAAAR